MIPSHRGRLIGLILFLLVLIWFSTRDGEEVSDNLHGRGDIQRKAAASAKIASPINERERSGFSPSTPIGNNPPVVKSIRLLPIPVSAGEVVRAEVITEDKDGDFVQLTYEWQVNGKPISGNDLDTLSGDQVHSADTILVFVTPSDPNSKGATRVSPLTTVLNRSPEIVSLPPSTDENGKYTYQIVAKDPDLDSLSYILLKGPPGMEVHPTTGLVQWVAAPVSESQSHVGLEVNDGKGGKAVQQFTLQITATK